MLTLRLPAGLEHLRRFIRFVSDFAQSHGFSEKRAREVELAVEEALVNIFRYAYPVGKGEAELRCKMSDDGKLTIEIEDSGVSFDLTATPEPDLCSDIAHRRIGGLGIFIIRKMANEVHYRREDGDNILTIIIYPEREASPEPPCPEATLEPHGKSA